ncbi:MAG: DegV family protein [Acidimicrobiales bacterium]
MITDSSACVPAELVSKLGICVLPISVYLSDESAGDVEALTDAADLPEHLANEELAGANHPFVTEYLDAIETPGFDAAVLVTPAIEFATMYRNAGLAATLSARPARSVDARTAAAGQALVVLAGAEAAAEGANLDEVVAVIENAAHHVELVASLASLEQIRRSGPLPDGVLDSPGLEGSRSVFRMRNGVVEPIGTVATSEEALKIMRSLFKKSSEHGVERATVFHSQSPELADQLVRLLGGVDFVTGFSVAMQVHTGGGVVGAAWIPGPSPR